MALQDWLADGTLQVHAEGPDRARRERPDPVPQRHQERLLPAVLVRDGGARPAARHPVPGRLRIHLRFPRRRRRMAGHHARRACLAGAVLLGVRVAAIRADPVRLDRAGDRVRADLHRPSPAAPRPGPRRSPRRPPRRARGPAAAPARRPARTTSASSSATGAAEPGRGRRRGRGRERPGHEPVGGVRPGGGRAADPRPGGAVGGAAGDQAAALAPPQAPGPAGPGGRRVGARGLARAPRRPG